ncbi:parB-like partition protein [Leptothrix cholodnii SP-6]|uniref:ParB-like partition protein n=1 Tax=Leptothrix cholodnii (strain ATCC 51168 / LMG 8142 / SP-6) TaxID=395495 RepID=B1Y179_LEPCP|nr:ParB/RepB/Spo0J family partition protein [Leptothrix cholodnii]ACB33056.1 parB-like partition protein [Leptothrix cholodnii SP-6]
MALQLEDLVALDAPTADASGTPLMLALDAIDEDPEQPRREFDESSLQALADTIRERGVRQPISVRPHPAQPGRWLLNFGARRLRAARMAGHAQIPVFVDTTADRYDQVIENEQREGLRPLELALFVQKRLALGESQAEIARKLGKSRQWVSLVTAMIDPPDWLMQAYREGRCRGLKELHELRKLHEGHPQQVEAWQKDQSDITRSSVQALRADLAVVAADPPPIAVVVTTSPEPSTPRGLSASVQAVTTTPTQAVIQPDPMPVQSRGPLKLQVEMNEQRCELLVTLPPAQLGHVYVKRLDGGEVVLAPAGALKLLGFMSD